MYWWDDEIDDLGRNFWIQKTIIQGKQILLFFFSIRIPSLVLIENSNKYIKIIGPPIPGQKVFFGGGMVLILLSLEGNIGAGKSTFLKFLEGKKIGKFEIKTIHEPIEEWTRLNDVNPLKEMYENPKYTAMFQMLTIFSHSKISDTISYYDDNDDNNIVVVLTERCWLSNKEIFANLMIDRGSIDSVEASIYNYIVDNMMKTKRKPDGYVYLQTSIDNCFERIRSRNRCNESAVISKEYLERLESYTNYFLRDKNVLNVDNDKDRNLIEDYSSVIDDIEIFINSLIEKRKKKKREGEGKKIKI